MKRLSGILSLIGFSNLAAPSPFSALPPVIYHNASPKAISGRTSYIRVRLEFLRYPQVIPGLFNGRGCGPPRCLTTASTCSWIGHPVSGLMQVTMSPYSDSLSLRLQNSSSLSLLLTLTRRPFYKKYPITHKRALGACRHKVSGSISLPSRLFSPFPHGTASLSVTE